MAKNKEFTEVLGILDDVYGWNDTNKLTNIQAELVNDVISVVKKLTIPVVSQCACTPDETTGTTTVRCCNVCGKPAESFWHYG